MTVAVLFSSYHKWFCLKTYFPDQMVILEPDHIPEAEQIIDHQQDDKDDADRAENGSV